MDEHSQTAVSLLNAIAAAMGELARFAHSLFLKTRAYSVSLTQSRFVLNIGPDKSIGCGCSLLRDDSFLSRVVFEFQIRWTASQWLIQSETIDELPDQYPVNLWSSPEYSATTIEGAIQQLQRAVNELIASVDDPRVAACLATIEPKH